MPTFDLNASLTKCISLAVLPTPIEKHKLLSEKYGVNFFIKRDDFADPVAGGTKLRLFEYILQDAVDKQATDLITIGQIHSNQCRLVSYWGKRLGMDVHLFFNSAGIRTCPQILDGNMLLSCLFTKNVEYLSGKNWDFCSLRIEQLKKRLKKKNKVPYFIQLGGQIGIGTLGIIKLVKEIVVQNGGTFPYSHVVIPVGTAHTIFGFDIAFSMMPGLWEGAQPEVLGISVVERSEKLKEKMDIYYKKFNESMGSNVTSLKSVFFYDDYIGGGYSAMTENDCKRLIDAARTYGLILDPVYTLKPFYGVLDLIKKGVVPRDSKILFLYTGQQYNIFTEKQSLLPHILDIE